VNPLVVLTVSTLPASPSASALGRSAGAEQVVASGGTRHTARMVADEVPARPPGHVAGRPVQAVVLDLDGVLSRARRYGTPSASS
jgi:hypothetical protein